VRRRDSVRERIERKGDMVDKLMKTKVRENGGMSTKLYFDSLLMFNYAIDKISLKDKKSVISISFKQSNKL
jgi:hypothetical protein